MKKKLLKIMSVALAAALIICVIPIGSVFAAEADPDYIEYTVPDGQSAVVTGYNGTLNGALVIPNTLDGYPVTKIANSAFSHCSNLTSIGIPSTVTSIGDRAFFFSGLTSINIPVGVTSIGYEAFRYCRDLSSVTVPDTVISIGDDAFSETYWYDNQNKGLVYAGKVAYKYKGTMPQDTSFTLKNDTVGIADYAFWECDGLKTISLPNTLVNIGNGAFKSCYSLTGITIPGNVKSIGDYAFSSCRSLTDVTIPNNVISMGLSAFSSCTGLTEVIIGSGITKIGNSAFYGCSELKTVHMSNSVTCIEENAFKYCPKIKELYYYGPPKQWNRISIGSYNTNLTAAKRYYICDMVGHKYDNACDAVCNVCDEVRTVGPHVYTNSCDTTCNICGGIRTITHTYDNSCDTTCNVCGATRSITHTYDNACDTTCNVCGNVRSVGPHVYDNACDTTCNVCGATRSITHSYKTVWSKNNSQHWHECSVCGNKKDVAAHVYDGMNDATCNICGYVRSVEYKKFPDVPSNAWYYDAVNFCTSKGYISGYGTGYFGPDDNIQRQDFVLILSRIDGVDLSKYEGRSKFSDIPSGQYYTAAVNWASENGIVSGYTNGKFGLGDSITREQLVLILFRYAERKYGTQSYGSAKARRMYDYYNVSDWARAAIEWAIDTGVISGMDGGIRIAPTVSAGRSQIAQILYNINRNNILPF